MRWLIAAAALFFSAASIAAPAFVQSAIHVESTSGNVADIPFGSNVTAGSRLFIGFRHLNTATVSGVADGVNGAWTQLADRDINGTVTMKVYTLASAGAGATTVAITFTADTTPVYMLIGEYSGAETQIDTDSIAGGASTDTTCTAVSATAAGQILIGMLWKSANNAVSPTSGETERQETDDAVGQLEDIATSGAGDVSATWTHTNASRTCWNGIYESSAMPLQLIRRRRQ